MERRKRGRDDKPRVEVVIPHEKRRTKQNEKEWKRGEIYTKE